MRQPLSNELELRGPHVIESTMYAIYCCGRNSSCEQVLSSSELLMRICILSMTGLTKRTGTVKLDHRTRPVGDSLPLLSHTEMQWS